MQTLLFRVVFGQCHGDYTLRCVTVLESTYTKERVDVLKFHQIIPGALFTLVTRRREMFLLRNLSFWEPNVHAILTLQKFFWARAHCSIFFTASDIIRFLIFSLL